MYARQHALDHADQTAFIMATSGETVTFGEYEARCNQVAHFLRAAGLKRGDHIAVFMENQLRMLEIEGAAERAGLYYTLINIYLAPDEVAYIVTNSRSRLLFSSPARRDVAEAAAARCPELERKLMTGPDAPPVGWESYEAVVADFPRDPIPDESLNPAPLYHSAPQASVGASLRLGSTTVVMEHFDAEQWLALVERYRVTNCQMVPVMFSRLLRLPEEVRARYDTSSLECIVHAAAPCPEHVKRGMIDWLGPIITEYYGATEANGFTHCDSAQWLAHPGTVGRPILGELLILDDAGHQCPTGVDGTIWFRGATAFQYFQEPAKTAESRSSDGMTSTVGDVGHVDDEGYLYLTDRKTYMIISGGVNIYPQETENLLSAHPAVLDVAVIGVPNEDMGEEVKAVVQLANPGDAGPDLAQELISFCRDRQAHFKCPKTVDFVAELPRSPTGKLYKRVLRDAYWAGHKTSIV